MQKPVPMLTPQYLHRPFARSRVWTGDTSFNALDALRRNVLFTILLVAITASAASSSSTKAEILAFDLSPVANSSEFGAFEVSLGPKNGENAQRISLLVSLYTNSDAMMEVPIAFVCSAGPIGDWNAISEPSAGAVVVTGTETIDAKAGEGTSGSIVLRWNPSSATLESDSTLNLTLRKGRGDAAMNTTIIETNMPNDGEYPWDAAATFRNKKLKSGSDYSLMLWTDDPPRRSISGYFTLKSGPRDKVEDSKPASPANRNWEKKCLEYLASNGGFYNISLDSDFQRGESYVGFSKNTNTTWQVHSSGVGSTTLSFESYDASGKKTTSRFSHTNMDLISHSSLGRGMFSINMLQATRNANIVEMNIVALNLGTERHPGSAVLGGYDDSLINKNQRAVFPRRSDLSNAFHAPMVKISVVAADAKATILDEWTNADSVADVGLTYDDFGIRLSQAIIDSLLPLIGNPKFDNGVNGYVFDGEPRTDFHLNFGFFNGSVEMEVKVPGSSLVVTESSNDNPLTPHNETGRTYLRISPTPDGSPTGQFLGRSFLQHVYIIDSPSTIAKFHMSALPSQLPSMKKLVAASPDSIKIFEGKLVSPTSGTGPPRVGPMVGGIAGGIFVLAVVAYGCFIVRRRARLSGSHRDEKAVDSYPMFDSEPVLGHIIHYYRGGVSRGNRQSNKTSSILSTATIPIRYSPSFEKEIGAAYRYSPSQKSQAMSRAPSQPVILLPSTSAPQDRAEFDKEEIANDRESTLYTTLSAIQPRNSKTPNASREHSPAPLETDVPGEPIPQLYRSATVGRMIPAGKVRSVDGSTPPETPGVLPTRSKSHNPGNASGSEKGGHTRTASLGRVVSPTEVEVATISRRSSARTSPGGSGRAPRGGSAGSGGSGNSNGSGSLEDLREENSPIAEQAHKFPLPPQPRSGPSPKPQSPPGETELDYQDAQRHLTTQTRSSFAPLSPCDALALPQPPYGTSSTQSDSSLPSTPMRPESTISDNELNRAQVDLPSLPHSISGSGSSDAEVFGLRAVSREGGGVYMSNEGWLVSGSERSGESARQSEEVREEQFLNSRSGSKSSRRDQEDQ